MSNVLQFYNECFYHRIYYKFEDMRHQEGVAFFLVMFLFVFFGNPSALKMFVHLMEYLHRS
jgi:hypothetical protein